MYSILPFVALACISSPALCSQMFVDECISNVDCAQLDYCARPSVFRVSGECGLESCDLKPVRCERRLTAMQQCSVSRDDCAAGLYCAFDVPGVQPGDGPVCVTQIGAGQKCAIDATKPCQGHPSFQCLRSTLLCERFAGVAGVPCEFDRECDQDGGFFCDQAANRCVPKKASGEPCGLGFSNNECAGYCARNEVGDNSFTGLCAPARALGERCMQDDQCVVGLVCNANGFEPGVCARDIMLIRKLGISCNMTNDLCDRNRNLICESARCVQRSTAGSACTAQSPLSSCSPGTFEGAPLECRRPLSFTKKAPFSVDTCVRIPATVSRGQICSLSEQARCESGSVCMPAPGVENVDFEDPTPPLSYCVKIRPVGGKCGNPFRLGCPKGAFCINRRCTVQDEIPQVRIRFGGESSNCENQRCAQGLECRAEGATRSCQQPVINVGAGDECFPLVNSKRQCPNGTFCTRDVNRDGIRRCLPLGDAGQFCESDSCKAGLKCRPFFPRIEGIERTCYDPENSLGVGQPCSVPRNGVDPCGVAKLSRFGADTLLQCLAVGDGSRKCAVPRVLLQLCSVTDNLLCISGLKCTSNNVCE